MKVMSREFTRAEKVLIVVLAVVLFGLLYYKFVFLTTNDVVQTLKSEAETTQTELDIANAKLAKLQKMDQALAENDDMSIMESYNNSKEETAFLNKALSDVEDYSITFSDITKDGNQIRRSFALQFVTSTYQQALDVVSEISYGEYRCLVDDINYTLSDSNKIYIDLTATFFETMVGGHEDSALPKDESEQIGTEPDSGLD